MRKLALSENIGRWQQSTHVPVLPNA
jgi:hypothetical protein